MPFCIPRAQHCSANSLLLLKQYEDALGGRPYKDCPKVDWNTFPGLDPMVATVLEWGHSFTDDQWTEFPEDAKEFKLNVSEWLLNSHLGQLPLERQGLRISCTALADGQFDSLYCRTCTADESES